MVATRRVAPLVAFVVMVATVSIGACVNIDITSTHHVRIDCRGDSIPARDTLDVPSCATLDSIAGRIP